MRRSFDEAELGGFGGGDCAKKPRKLEVSWFSLLCGGSGGQLGLCGLPGRKDTNLQVRRDLEVDVQALREGGVQCVVLLTPHSELNYYLKSRDIFETYSRHGIMLHHHPIERGLPPSVEICLEIHRLLEALLLNKSNVILQCSDGKGRSGTVLATFLMDKMGSSADVSIEQVRSLRGHGAIQTLKQFNFINAWPQLRKEQLCTNASMHSLNAA